MTEAVDETESSNLRRGATRRQPTTRHARGSTLSLASARAGMANQMGMRSHLSWQLALRDSNSLVTMVA